MRKSRQRGRAEAAAAPACTPAVADRAAALQLITYHAVTRYVQRVLGVTVADLPESLGYQIIAELHCSRIGRDVASVRDEMLSPALEVAMRFGCPFVSLGRFRARIGEAGQIISIYEPSPMRSKRFEFRSDAETRRLNARYSRRHSLALESA